MKFAVTAWSKGRARAGVIKFAASSGGGGGSGQTEVEIETPALLLSTRKGLPYFIPPDLLPSLPSPDAHILQFSPLHFLESLTTNTISNIGGLHKMLGLNEYRFAAVPRDSVVCLPDFGSTNMIGASFETPCGRLLIKPLEYVKMISSMEPNSWATLADEVPAWVSEKRNRTSVDRTLRWLDDCLALGWTVSAPFGAVVGGSSLEERQRCAQEVAKRNLKGYWIGGFGLGENMEERSPLLNAVTDNLPEDKPRQICGLGLPEEVLQGIAAGVDLFDSMYIYHLTMGGFALTFPVERVERNVFDTHASDVGSDQTKINLKATVYRKDTSPIVDGCSCYTCKNHTKAYLNHLLNVHEMLAQTLLEIHNTHHYLMFFRKIREAIKQGKFEQFRQQFIESRRDHISETSLGA